MAHPSDGPAGTDTFPALCGHTHLFPGARCRVQGLPDPGAFVAGPRPLDVDLRFSDGVMVAARLRTEPGEGPPLVLSVPAHTTAAGTRIDARAWRVRDLVVREGADVELVVGALPRS
ncbi:hypothetical protein [Streptomyces sp. E5N298]|jgi:hypothetical protein|uniref:hypothetical protein n=1 Tax=Streptomyces sp. E5N298 TaxID=1851983 RepID=UPI000EF5F48C|nr:hypothetical protein [Streptomyces sp. E5N298]